MEKITKEQFEARYTLNMIRNSLGKVGFERFTKDFKLVAFPCDCDFEGCQGWRMEIKKR